MYSLETTLLKALTYHNVQSQDFFNSYYHSCKINE